MRSAELAKLAGVTIRTIRYYHQVGALSEPPRQSNGYRDYSVDHLVAVLKIRQLTSSGLSLAQATAALSDEAANEASLDEIDRVLEAQIAALTTQREELARARAGRHVGLSRMAAALRIKPADTSAAILLAHLYKDHPQIDRWADALLEPELRSALLSLQDRFDAIDHATTDSELEELATQMQSLVAELAAEIPPITDEQSQLLLDLVERDLTDRQKDFLRHQE